MQNFLKVFALGISSLVACIGALDSHAQDQKLPPSETASGPPAAGDKIVGEKKVNWTNNDGKKGASVEKGMQISPVPTTGPSTRDAANQLNPQPSEPQTPLSQQSDSKEGKVGDLLLNAEQVSALVKLLTNNPEVIQMQDGEDLILLIGGGIELRFPGFRQSRSDSKSEKPAGDKGPAKTPTNQRFIDPPELENFKAL